LCLQSANNLKLLNLIKYVNTLALERVNTVECPFVSEALQ